MGNVNIFSFVLVSLLAAPAFAKISVKPTDYDIHIITHAEDFQDSKEPEKLTYDGAVKITFSLVAPKPEEKFEIVLNTNEKSKIRNLTLEGVTSAGKNEPIGGVNHVIENDRLIINITNKVPQYDKFNLNILFSNPYGNDMSGFYRSSYKDPSGKTRWLLTTHFEPIFARKAFPCFDQPDLKAYFNIKLTVPEHIKTVLCNTPVSEPKPDGSNLVFTCGRNTIPMSTYLVAFTASEFKSTDAVTFKSDYPDSKDRTLKTYGREDIIRRGEALLAQLAGKEALDGLTQYLGIGYAFEKVDQVGIPDFSAGAMENWGHISFREKSLFFNEKTGSTTTKQANVLTITHELVHQWFGNLVTLESWDYIWLNEAFANYIEYVIASKFKNPNTTEWNLMNQLVVNEIHSRAFETDGLNSSKPLNNKITDEKLIYSSFNDIPYAKGAAVLRMWNFVLKDKFQKSLKEYISDRKTSTANPKDLMKFLKNNGMSENFFTTWTDQAGYPVVEVKKVANNVYTLTQSRFLWEKLSSKSLWAIPISFTTDISSNSGDKFDFMEKEKLNITVPEKSNWVIVNNQQAGYYRVNYDLENWKALSSVLGKNSSAFTEVNRAQIVNDIFSLARSLQKKYVEYSTALNLASYLKNETSQIVLKTALNAFDFLQTKLFKTEVEDKFKEYVRDIVTPHFKSLNNTNLKHVDKLKNIDISRWACALEHKSCVEEALYSLKEKTYDKFPDTQGTILCTGIRKNEKYWDEIFTKYQNEEDSSLKLVYLTALGCTDSAKKAEEFLNKTLQPNSGIRKQDLVSVVTAVYNGNLKNVDIALKFAEANFKQIAKEYGGINPLGKILVGIARKLNKEESFNRLKKLSGEIRKEESLKGAEESLENALQIAESNYIWVKEKESQFREYFKGSGSIVSYSLTLLSLSFALVFQF